ncbi:MAG: DUF362 domain-containing protein [Acidobacteriota bacterium]
MNDTDVVLVRAPAARSWGRPPYEPSVPFPERPGAGGDNEIYGAVRAAWHGLGLDANHAGRPEWNPLRALVGAGGRVVLKPNLVRHCHGTGGPLEAVVTDPRILRAVLDYVVDAVAPEGEVIIADSPLQSCQMDRLASAMGLEELCAAAQRHGVRVRCLDYRREAVIKGAGGLIVQRTPLAGDPDGYVAVDLGAESQLESLVAMRRRFRVTQYDREITLQHHGEGRHEFLIPRSLLAADLVISLPKIKTHRKAGMTGALKNLVGINGSKAWLPHHRAGSVAEGGDEYLHPSLRKRWMTRLWERMDRTPSATARRLLDRVQDAIRRSGAVVPFPDPYYEGSWWGNRTMPAMVCDLNRIFVYADRQGRLQDRPVRRFLVLADAVTAGEGEGPLEPDPRALSRLIAGVNPVAVDWVAATLMGFAPERIPTLEQARAAFHRPLIDGRMEDLSVREIDTELPGERLTIEDLARRVERPFVAAQGWQGHIEAREEGPARGQVA